MYSSWPKAAALIPTGMKAASLICIYFNKNGPRAAAPITEGLRAAAFVWEIVYKIRTPQRSGEVRGARLYVCAVFILDCVIFPKSPGGGLAE